MSAATDVLLIDNTNNVWILGLKNAVSGAFVNDATCQIVDIRDADGDVVTGTTSISMTYKTSSDGDYYGAVPYTTTFEEDSEYTVHATATKDGVRADWRRKVRARYRNAP